jgi:hypothetical protein
MAELLYRTTSPTSKALRSSIPSAPVALEINSPEITSVGLPHSIHADRIIGLMLQQMVQRHAKLWTTIRAVAEDRRARDGNPRAQAKLEAKIKSLGALMTGLIPGKRGRYELRIHSFAGWDPQRDAVIKPGDPIPEKPWICTMLYVVQGEGQGRISYGSSSSPVLFLTHHCLSRSPQRWGVRTVSDLSAAIEEITTVVFNYLTNRAAGSSREIPPDKPRGAGGDAWFDTWFDTPPEGVRLPMPGGEPLIVVKKHETRPALVVATVLN